MRWLKRIALLILVLLIAAQFIPVKRTNPPVNPANTIYAAGIVPANIHAILQRSCKDCHSDETHWPWYSYVAPVSWLVAFDVHDARGEVNLSRWSGYTQREKDPSWKLRTVHGHRMPDSNYTLIHRGARMNEGERVEVCQWTEAARKMMVPSPGQPPEKSQ